jgi:hypothetical protein
MNAAIMTRIAQFKYHFLDFGDDEPSRSFGYSRLVCH